MNELSTETADRLKAIHAKLREMGVRDVKLSKDAERWNVMTMEERGQLLCRVFEDMMSNKGVPLIFNDSKKLPPSAPGNQT